MSTKVSFPAETYSGTDVVRTSSKSSGQSEFIAVVQDDPDTHDIHESDWMLVHHNGKERFDGFVDTVVEHSKSIEVRGSTGSMTANDLLGLP